jgi:hypothetical protein
MADELVKGANTWLYDFTLKGKRHCGDTGKTRNRKVLARAYVEDLRSKLRAEYSNLALGIKPDPKTTCGELLNEWLETHMGDHAIRVERDWRLHLLPTFKDVKAMDVTPPMIEMVRNAYPQRHGPGTPDRVDEAPQWQQPDPRQPGLAAPCPGVPKGQAGEGGQGQ